MKKSITIKDFVSIVNYQIGEGSEYLWDCYGPNACNLEWGKADLSASAEMIYDTKTWDVYEISVWDCRDEPTKVYRWIKPEYIKRHKKESKERGFKFNIAIDKIKYEETTPAKLLGYLKRLCKEKASDKKSKKHKKVWIN